MVDSKVSFYLQNNNNLFNSDVLVVCYKADEKEIKEFYGKQNMGI